MKHGATHLIWMGAGFVALLVLGKIVGVNLILLFPLFCLFMMVSMMLGMDHSKDKNDGGASKHGH